MTPFEGWLLLTISFFSGAALVFIWNILKAVIKVSNQLDTVIKEILHDRTS